MTRCELLACLLVLTLPCAAAEAQLVIRARVLATLHEAALFTADGVERTAERKKLLRRQQSLRSWFESHGKSLRLSDCRTDADRANYRDFRGVMATEKFLRMSAKARARYIARVDRRLATMCARWAEAWAQFSPHRPPAEMPNIAVRYFGFGAYTTTAAMYYPKSQTVYLNLNHARDDPDDLVDSLEHELWHHFIPLVTADTVAQNIWFEGFTEFYSELWAEPFRRAREEESTHSVEYPVQTAYVTLRYLQNREQTHAITFGTTPMPDLLAASQAKLAKLSEMLGNWGWKEDDGAPGVALDRYILNGRFSAPALSDLFRKDRQLLLDLIQAITVCELRNAREAGFDDRWARKQDLPEHLKQNLIEVFKYVKNPRRQHANR